MNIPKFPELGKWSVVSCLVLAGLAGNLNANTVEAEPAGLVPPQPVSQPSPAYSIPMRYDQVHGAVRLSFVVDAKGNVTEPVVIKADDDRMAQSALAAVKRWTYRPALKHGEPTSCRIVQTIDFPRFDPANPN